jgi:4-hydroxy-tetrahydrodipicolinate synthase
MTLLPETIAAMAEEGMIAGMKASSTDLYHFDHVAKRVSDEFGLLSGQDTSFVEQALLGAKVRSAVANGRIAEALAAQRRLYPLPDALFAEEFPAASGWHSKCWDCRSGR